MEHGPACHQVVDALFKRIFEDIEPADFEIWHAEIGDVQQVKIARNGMPVRGYASGQPLRHRSIATSNFEAAPPGLKTELLNVAAVQRVKQFRHQCQSLLLARQVVRQNVFVHVGALPIVFAVGRLAQISFLQLISPLDKTGHAGGWVVFSIFRMRWAVSGRE
jgi:hypothetical protein